MAGQGAYSLSLPTNLIQNNHFKVSFIKIQQRSKYIFTFFKMSDLHQIVLAVKISPESFVLQSLCSTQAEQKAGSCVTMDPHPNVTATRLFL
jgi:hypothetical protein